MGAQTKPLSMLRLAYHFGGSASVHLIPAHKLYNLPVQDEQGESMAVVEDTRDVAVIQRRGHEDMALIPAGELASLRETAHPLRSPANAARLLSALTRARKHSTKSQDLAELRTQLGLEE